MKEIGKNAAFRIVSGVLTAAVMFMGVMVCGYAQAQTRLMQSIVSGDRINLYISNLDTYTEAEGQIGRDAVEIVGVDNNVPRRTVFMIDNSKSVSEANLNKVKEIMAQYLEQKLPEEKVSIAVFGETVEQYLITDETDASKVTKVFDQITAENKETYLTDALYDELKEYQSADIYTRFVVVSDGVDNKSIGYTKEELTDLLEDQPFPVFSIGCMNQSNEENLKNMFALSRLTNGNYYLLDDFETYDEIVAGLTEPVSCVQILIPESLKDGSTQNILLRFQTTAGELEVKDEIAMPFGIREPETEPAAEPTPEPIVEPILKPVAEVVPQPEPVNGIDSVSVVALLVMIAAAIYLILTVIRKKKQPEKKQQEKEQPEKQMERSVDLGLVEEEEQKTVFLGEEEQKTVYLGEDDDAEARILVVRDADHPERIFRYPLRGRVILGRKKDRETCSDVNIVINYDASVSGRHLAVSLQGNRLYIEDLNSSNGTFINGERIRGVVPVAPGCRIELGRVSVILDME